MIQQTDFGETDEDEFGIKPIGLELHSPKLNSPDVP
jgi:hypothetical protein